MAAEVESNPNDLATYMDGGTGNVPEDQQLDTSKAEEQAREEKVNADARAEHTAFINARAEEIYKSGDSRRFMREVVSKIHADDIIIIDTMILSIASTQVENGTAVNIGVTGRAGIGKTHLYECILLIVPDGIIYDKAVSPKALYRAGLVPGMIIIFNDQDIPPDLQNTLKNLHWDRPTEYEAADRNNPKANVPYVIPERTVYWDFKVEGSGDEQVQNRECTLWADETDEHVQRCYDLIDWYDEKPSRMDELNNDFEICKAIWSNHILKDKPRRVAIKFKISGGNKDMRTRKLFQALIKASCIMDASNRECDEDGSLLANKKDFVAAAEIMNPLLKREKGDMVLKVNPQGQKFISVYKDIKSGSYTFGEVMADTGMNNWELNVALDGRRADGLDGICAKVPGVETSMNTRTFYDEKYKDKPDDIRKTESRKVVHWNKEAYEKAIGKAEPFMMDGKSLDDVMKEILDQEPLSP